MPLYLSLLEGVSPTTALPIFATADPRIIEEVRRIIAKRLDTWEDGANAPVLSLAAPAKRRSRKAPVRAEGEESSLRRDSEVRAQPSPPL
jgi:hypothetical protein